MKPIIGLDLDGVIRHNNKSMGTGDIPKEKRNRADLVKLYENGLLPTGYYTTKPSEVLFIDRALEALAMFHDMGWPCHVISNQEAVGVGIITKNDLLIIQNHMDKVIEKAGGKIETWSYCVHFPDEGCECRKPKPGMFFELERDSYMLTHTHFDLSQTYYIGDNPSDMEAGKAAGCKTIHIKLSTADAEFQESEFADEVVGSLFGAACMLVKRHGKEK